jgi:hypothetical protein
MEHKIKDQKVFVKLKSVTALQKRYIRAEQDYRSGRQITEVAKAAAKARMEAIAELELPIS